MNYLLLPALLFLTLSCQSQPQAPAILPTYPDHVGDIRFDPETDKADFHLCDSSNIYQYYNFATTYKGEKKAVRDYCLSHFKPDKAYAKESGYVVIRFVVNCRGETDRFRIQEISPEYQPKTFPPMLVSHLLTLTKALDGWIPGKDEDANAVDSYVYLNFIIRNGKLIDVAP